MTALVAVALAAVAFAPQAMLSWRLPYVERPLVLLALAMAVFALGLIYETAERLLGPGRGIYAVAVFCSVPAVSVAATTPALMIAGGIMLMTSLGMWMAVRAEGPERPYFLGMIALLLAGGGFLFGFQPACVSLLFVAWLAATRSGSRMSVPLAVALAAVACAGAAVRLSAFPGLLDVPFAHYPADRIGLVYSLPWALWPLAVFALVRRPRDASAPVWRAAAALCVVAGLAVAVLSRGAPIVAAAAGAPLIALVGSDLAHAEFNASRARIQGGVLIPAALIALVIAARLGLQASGIAVARAMTALEVMAALVLGGAVLWTAVHRLSRWNFGLLYVSGVALGLWSRPQAATEIAAPAQSATAPFILMSGGAAVLIWLVLFFTAGRSLRVPRRRDTEFQFGDDPFRVFGRGAGQAVEAAALDATGREAFTFAVFGDVAGAESPLSTRRSGFLAFREFARALRDEPPAFAISLGDLALQATPGAYRRLRRLLSRLAIPVAVVPGNHDVFVATEYDARCFHDTFGADNSAFRVGPVDFVLLNNAWGSVADEQFEWLERTLSLCRAPFRLVFCHKPPFDFRENVFYAMEERPHAERLHEVFVRHGVTAVFSGHIHTLLAEQKDGITYVVSGGGGSRLVKGDAGHHYLRVQVTKGELTFRALALGAPVEAQALMEIHWAARL